MKPNTLHFQVLTNLAGEARRMCAKKRTVERMVEHYFGSTFRHMVLELPVDNLTTHYANKLRCAYVARMEQLKESFGMNGIRLSKPKLTTSTAKSKDPVKVLQFELDIQYADLETEASRRKFLHLLVDLRQGILPKYDLDEGSVLDWYAEDKKLLELQKAYFDAHC